MTGADSYLSTQVFTASPYRLHLMVVEGAIQFANLGTTSLEENDFETAHLALSKSRDFVAELLGGLKEEYDPLLTARMKQLFFFAYANLAEGERERDVKRVQAALKVLQLHHETWTELAAKLHSPVEPSSDKSQGESRAWSA